MKIAAAPARLTEERRDGSAGLRDVTKTWKEAAEIQQKHQLFTTIPPGMIKSHTSRAFMCPYKAAERATLLHSDPPAHIRTHALTHASVCVSRPCVCKCRRRGTREIRLIAFRHQPDSPSGLEAGGCLNRCLTPSLRRAVDDETACLQPHTTQGAADCSPRHPVELRDNVRRYF